jgi:hypothetical protein
LQADVAARHWPKKSGRREGAKATVAFAVDVSEKSPGTFVGTPGVDAEVLRKEGFHTLTATFTPDKDAVGQELLVLLMVEDKTPETSNDHYLFDQVRCRVVPGKARQADAGEKKP